MKTFHEWLRERQQQEGLMAGRGQVGGSRHEQREPIGSAQGKERKAQTHGIAGENAQGEASVENAQANARHRESDTGGVRSTVMPLP